MSATTFDPQSESHAAARRSRWIPWTFFAGMLGVVAVNGVLITAAVSTFTGVTVGASYDRGRTYNHVLAEAARQEALGWQAELALADGGMLNVAVREREGRPVSGALAGTLLRPLEGERQALELAEVAPGRWVAPVAARPGQWEARLTLSDAGGRRHLDTRQRLVLR